MLFDKNWEKPADIKLEPWQDLLLRSAKLIEKAGWVQNSMHVQGRGYCIVGAMVHISAKDGIQGGAFVDAQRAMDKVMVGGSVNWNDRYGRTKDEVVTKLREVANGG